MDKAVVQNPAAAAAADDVALDARVRDDSDDDDNKVAPQRLCSKIHVDLHYEGLRADHFLCKKIKRLSRSKARHIMSSGDLLRDNQPLKPSSRVHGGETLSLWRVPPPEPAAPEHFATLYRDAKLWVIDKPAGLAVHPSARYFRSTLTQLLRRQQEARGEHGRIPSLCHRLDRETSGVLILATDLDTERRIKQGFAHSLIKKTYWALVQGVPSEARFSVDAPLLAGQGEIRIKMSAHRDGLPALTHFERLAVQGQRSLIACYPQTGRTHQIRAHLAIAGYPIVGDKMYGEKGAQWFLRQQAGEDEACLNAELDWPRHCLHAKSLHILPELGVTPADFAAPWPDDLPPLPSSLG